MGGALMLEEYYVKVYPDPGDDFLDHKPIMTWLCPGCGRLVDWEFGCAHDNPEESALCDDCWVERYGHEDQNRSSKRAVHQDSPGQ